MLVALLVIVVVRTLYGTEDGHCGGSALTPGPLTLFLILNLNLILQVVFARQQQARVELKINH